MQTPDPTGIRIGALCERVGIKPERLRAWERRYQLLIPHRSPAGYRIYSRADEARVARMLHLIDRGYAPAEAARIAIHSGRASADPRVAAAHVAELHLAASGFDDSTLHGLLDQIFAQASLDSALSDVVLPYLNELGRRWQGGISSIAEVNFAATLVRGRLEGLARRWGAGDGPIALLACPPGELHDIGLLCFGLALRDRGWRITFLGGNTPISEISECNATLAPDAIILSAALREPFASHISDLKALSVGRSVSIGGPGATPEIAASIGALLLPDNPVTAADQLAAGSLSLQN